MSLIVSVLHLDRKAIKALRVTDPYSLHRVVYSLYEDVRSGDDKQRGRPSGILYADEGGDHLGRRVLMLADRAPAPSLPEGLGEVRSKPIPAEFLEQDHYRFRVIVNPTRRESASGKIVPVKGREAIAEWFLQRAESGWGFTASAPHLQVDRVDVLKFKNKQQGTVTLAQAHLQGQLRVMDRERFQATFAGGIGRGRAFGCGLLRIVPLIESPFA